MESIARNQATAAQIQHLEDATKNPLTGQAWPTGHEAIVQERRRMPVYGQYQQILDAYHQSQVIVLSSEQGSGKSTQVPQLILHDEFMSNLRIACTQPRRRAATELAKRVSEEMGVNLGAEVGYRVQGDRMVDEVKDKETRLVYFTEDKLIRQLLASKKLSEYACVILDEAHERTIDLDLLVALSKKLINTRKDFKLVIMSETATATRFQEYFDNCLLIQVPGRNFKVDILYLPPNSAGPSLVGEAAETVIHIHKTQKPGHILVFLPGEDEINWVCGLLKKHTTGLDIFPLHGKLSSEDQNLALTSSSGRRKCIVSTNIAEASRTIDGVVYVVDSGLSRQLHYNPRLRLNTLDIRPISQAQAQQRADRAGLTEDGKCYRLFSKADHDEMAEFTEPAIRCQALHSAVIKLVSFGHRKLLDFDWLDVPHPELLSRATQDVRDWGFLDDTAKLTDSGRRAARCPLDPMWYRAIEVADKLGCSMNMVDIAVVCSSQSSLFLRPASYRQVADVAKTAFAHPLSDHLTLANAFNAYMNARKVHRETNPPSFDLGEWCLENFLDMRALERARIHRLQVASFLVDEAKMAPTIVSVMDPDTVRKALAIALCTHTAIWCTGDQYRTVHENAPGLLSATSPLVDECYEWIVYSNFHSAGGKQYFQTATAIKAEWLAELPFFQDTRLPKKKDEDQTLRQPNVKDSLDSARARIKASKKE
ncbi:unnamed protein product [Clonostachys rhizophaga]|uniref:Pre-mRNA-splicing factor ATP-dependent RNA helicase PRP43 n=1 Tax=Clonostachys rhizophaga TaxID=160324 RepID=A0A9N9VQ34_9HYPO|nr:unnamed protein product [Clonostachys rhizophaga]